MWWSGTEVITLYPSQIMEKEFDKRVAPRFANRDMLKELIEIAHGQNLKVHAWFEFGFSSSYQEPDGGHILRAKPTWKALDNKGKLVSKNGFQWMNAFHPEVQNFFAFAHHRGSGKLRYRWRSRR